MFVTPTRIPYNCHETTARDFATSETMTDYESVSCVPLSARKSIQAAPSSSMNIKLESTKAYFPAAKYDTLDRKPLY